MLIYYTTSRRELHANGPRRRTCAQCVLFFQTDLNLRVVLLSRYALQGDAYIAAERATVSLSANNGVHHAHGGLRGFDKRIWAAQVLRGECKDSDEGAASVRFSYTSQDGEEGYPGRVTAGVVYTVTTANKLIVRWCLAFLLPLLTCLPGCLRMEVTQPTQPTRTHAHCTMPHHTHVRAF